MSTVEEVFGFDLSDPVQTLAIELAEADEKLIDDLIQARKDADMTQRDVAEALGVTQPSVQSFERSGNDPRLSTIRRYALAVRAKVTHQVDCDQLEDRKKKTDDDRRQVIYFSGLLDHVTDSMIDFGHAHDAFPISVGHVNTKKAVYDAWAGWHVDA